ncbi:DsbA family protein [Blastococcus tunisiensis]|uniref:Uncharacterized protein n=1 Tax=Blastococcus tunisiensis TaxID=1798228 RepID=A0A1I2IRK8_9ACTN|nr:hypothetical protein [Blastococcus sp. DSM 46838]SFF43446.1 hypothetical protein SAMN05216574_113141 [Blastococcus sp. DSM 46838]
MTGEQGSFWEYHDAVYALGFPPNSGQLTDDVLIRLARDLDVERSTATMQSQETLDAVTTDFREGQQLGVTGVLGLGDTTDLEFRAQSRIAELEVGRGRAHG